ncbi:hypothetical protein A2130_01160 [Candidatus Woesebacteria bacterium GWC2_33_12]|uniref:Uncharacterized protein n=1 Tax=Candidatus Woesebacteria bacterium GW2011_GWB1_33_22 TaxID=1618566 RepID=A0A0G0A2C7_9BACT|nr:MAG: hypothetical protein UR29_C0002G0121 [Candidatus Woesebacteria bacterium GW2011_GWC2_33_12]KKP42593.1 MAG: hypothetical protein UR33_C0002G0169 [Candidatus Woesebacteria bacterium GW2011_GWA2_33_20]KKP45336.1 MAG: hypothetical protein UR35_C0002G0169 [Candidatus Woesebacteria bacterium GW2011_GWB1_33_22]KKP47164.1 MAG: hypothetical protein UR37_C0002G0076 [Microgenomates group bacterium GW2011_GWC1_33_28]KKP51006.1 MAG: hypothetical protein UR41_C0002G0170 [Candidatus Woesebacteria bact
MSNGPRRDSQKFQIARAIIKRAWGRKILNTDLVAEDVGINGRHRVTEILSKSFPDHICTSGGVIGFMASDGGNKFLAHIEGLEDRIIEFERRGREL